MINNAQACNTVKNVLAAFWRDELSPQDAEAVRNHLLTCASCKDELSKFAIGSRLSLIKKGAASGDAESAEALEQLRRALRESLAFVTALNQPADIPWGVFWQVEAPIAVLTMLQPPLINEDGEFVCDVQFKDDRYEDYILFCIVSLTEGRKVTFESKISRDALSKCLVARIRESILEPSGRRIDLGPDLMSLYVAPSWF